MEAMREFPDKFFQLALIDPPYGIAEMGGATSGAGKNGAIRGYE